MIKRPQTSRACSGTATLLTVRTGGMVWMGHTAAFRERLDATSSTPPMPKIVLLMLALSLVSCAQPDAVAIRQRVGATPVDTVRAEMQSRFGVNPDTLELHQGTSIRLVYVAIRDPAMQARSPQAAYAADSLRFDRAFDQALWLWQRIGQRDGVDTISVGYQTLGAFEQAPLATAVYYFYPAQLEHPAERPLLDRDALAVNWSDALRSRQDAGKR